MSNLLVYAYQMSAGDESVYEAACLVNDRSASNPSFQFDIVNCLCEVMIG